MRVKFRNAEKTSFYSHVKSEVDKYFSENKLSKTANFAMAVKIFSILAAFLLLYFTLLFSGLSLNVKLAVAIVFGMVTALIGLNICHDAIHGSISNKLWVNKIFAIVFNIVGANAYVWHITHNIVHHTFTNIKGADEDLEIAPGLLRLHHTDKWKPIHRFQHYYAFLLYGLASLS
jgi:linoleoyl-CoA desaturase